MARWEQAPSLSQWIGSVFGCHPGQLGFSSSQNRWNLTSLGGVEYWGVYDWWSHVVMRAKYELKLLPTYPVEVERAERVHQTKRQPQAFIFYSFMQASVSRKRREKWTNRWIFSNQDDFSQALLLVFIGTRKAYWKLLENVLLRSKL